jgi:CotH kinase protein
MRLSFICMTRLLPRPFCAWLMVILLFALTGRSTASAQTNNRFPEIRITISQGQFNRLETTRGAKMELNNAIMMVNGDSAKVKEIHLRGNNSLLYRRKSLSVDLKKNIHLSLQGQSVALKKFDLINLVMDKNLWHNRWAFLTMSKLGFFPLVNTYCTVWINGKPQGIYLLIEKPHHASVDMKSPFMIRRGVHHGIDNEYDDTESKDEAKEYRRQYNSLYKPGSRKGSELYEYYSKAINLDNYFTWIGFNYLIMNGDYTDELFLYINPDTKLYQVIAWDYDDLLLPHPHEGAEIRNSLHPDRMIFSIEDSFDKTIVADDFLYAKYLVTLKKLLLDCDSTMLTETSQEVLHELELLSKDQENSRVTLFLDRDPFDFGGTKNDIGKAIPFLLHRRNSLLENLK